MCDIIHLVRRSYPKAFANVKNNMKVIEERRWYPYIRVLLLYPDIMTTIAEEDLDAELELGLSPFQRLKHESNRSAAKNFECNDATSLNFTSGGMTIHCSTTIVSSVDRERAQLINTKCKSEGTTELKRLQAIKKKLTSSRLTGGAQIFHIKKFVSDHDRQTCLEVAGDECGLKMKKKFTYIESCERANEVAASHGNKPVHTWSCIKDMALDLKPLMKDDEVQPKGRPNSMSGDSNQG